MPRHRTYGATIWTHCEKGGRYVIRDILHGEGTLGIATVVVYESLTHFGRPRFVRTLSDFRERMEATPDVEEVAHGT